MGKIPPHPSCRRSRHPRLRRRCSRSLLLLALWAPAPAALARPPAAPPPQVAISPSRFEVEIGGAPTVESFRVINLGQDPLEVRISLANWELDDGNQVVVIAPTEQSLDQWMVVNPLRFTIPPSQAQTVRFSIRPRVRPEPGEHRAMIYLDQILPDEPAGTGIRLRFQYGVAVYGFAGDVVRAGTLHGVRAAATDPLRFGFDVSSDGNAHVRMAGSFAIWPADLYPGSEHTGVIKAREGELPEGALEAGDLPLLPVLPGTRRELSLEPGVELAPGDYVLDLNGSLEQRRIDLAIPFRVPSDEPEVAGR